MPLALGTCWVAEEYWLEKLSLRALAHVQAVVLASWIVAIYTLWLPMMKLICNVG